MHAARRLTAASILVITLAALGAVPVAADCNLAGPVQEVLPTAEVAFVGTVSEVIGAMARFEVHEVWAGPVGHTVEVHGLASGVEFTEDDRHWEAGTTYLVLPYTEGGDLRDSICTATTEWTEDLAALRPADAVIHEPAEPAEASVPMAIPLAAVALAVVALVSIVAFRRSGDAAG